MPEVFCFRAWDNQAGEMRTSTRMATREKIEEIRAEIIESTRTVVDAALLKDGWTEKGFVKEQS